MTNLAIEHRILSRVGTALKERDEQLRAFITVGLGKLAEAVKHDVKQLIDRQAQLDEAQRVLNEHLNILATHMAEHVKQLEKRVQNLEERLVMVAGSGNSFPADPQRQ